MLGDDAWTLLARRRPYRKRRRRTRTGVDPRPLGQIRLVSLRHVDLTREWGHWEGDLIVGAANRLAAVVLTERVSRYLLLGALQTRTTVGVVGVVAALLDQVPTPIRHSLCWDQGRELTAWPHLEEHFGINVYFCSPRSPWRKPLVENTCGLLRRWLPIVAAASTAAKPRWTPSPLSSTTCPAGSSNGKPPKTDTITWSQQPVEPA